MIALLCNNTLTGEKTGLSEHVDFSVFEFGATLFS